MTRRLGVAGLQLKKDPFNPESNIAKLEQTARLTRSRYPWVDLIFTGELYVQHYGTTEWKEHANKIPNALTDRLSRLAREIGCWLVPGSLLERKGAEVYNTAVVFNPDGALVATYRKIFPWMPYEDTSYGTEFVTFDIPNVSRIGLVICYDLWFPELFRTLSWMGAEIILQPSMTYTPDREVELVLTQAQAIMNQCYVLNSNVISPLGGGQSIFVDPEGRVLQKVGTHEEIMTEVIDVDKVSWVRQNGSYGICPVWKSFRDSPLDGKFPIYQKLKDGEVFKNLGELKIQKSIRKWET